MKNILIKLHELFLKPKKHAYVYGEIYEMDKWYEELRKDYPLNKDIHEIIYYAYCKYGSDCFRKIRGAYSALIQLDDEIRIYAPPFNLFPLYYTCKEEKTYVSDSFFTLANARQEKLIVQAKGLLELFSFSPCMSMHQSVYKNMYALAAGHVLIYRHDQVTIEKWYQIPVYEHKDSYEESVKKVKELVQASIQAQKENVRASFLSGGLDSSIIVSQCANQDFHTYSLDYEENEIHFQSNRFQKSLDAPYIKEMYKKNHLKHETYTITQQELCECLEAALWAREVPGMADIDASLYWFLKRVKKHQDIIFSGECADEVFGGYPWFYRHEYDQCETFPFLAYQKERLLLLAKPLQRYPFSSYIQHKYDECIQQIKEYKMDPLDQHFQKMRQCTFDYFMQTLVVRQVCMSKACDIVIRVPFADVALNEYVYNLPADYCYRNHQEKAILRDAFKDDLPDSIFQRKKNPFPKTHHPYFAELIANKLQDCLKQDSILLQIFDKDALNELIKSRGKSYQFPWFGQLMSGPQLLAYIYTLHVWLSDERIQLDIS